MKTTEVTLQDIIDQIKSSVAIEDVVTALDLTKRLGLQRTGHNLQGDCITGHESSGHRCFSIDTKVDLYYCFSCGTSGDAIELVRESEHLGLIESLGWLAEQFLPELLPVIEDYQENLPEEKKEFYRRAALFQRIYREGKRLLYEPEGKMALDYLVDIRGYDPAILPKTEFIYWDTDQNIRQYLKGCSPALTDQVDHLPLQGAYGDEFRLAVPYRDRYGAITGFMKRAHVKEGFTFGAATGIRWDSTTGLEKTDLFGLNRIRKEETLILAEGYPDATYLPGLGMNNIVAFGQARFSEKYFEGLAAKNITRVVLALDNDGGTGLKNSIAFSKLLTERGLTVYVIDPKLFGSHKDPDEYVLAQGLDAFKNLVETARRGSEWYTEQLLSSLNLASDAERDGAIQKVFEYADSLESPVECDAVIGILQKAMEIPSELLAMEFDRVRKHEANKRIVERVGELQSQVKRLAQEGKEEEICKLLAEKPSEILSGYVSHRASHERAIGEFLLFKKERDAERHQGDRLGFELKRFADIDSQLNGVQPGLYIIGAYPNVGKTAFMTSLSTDILESNDEAAVLFFTMDDSRDTIINRFLAGKSFLEINQVQVAQKEGGDQARLDLAYEWLIKKAQEGKFDVKEINESLTMDAIEHAIRTHPNRERLLVFIDGVYNVPMEGRFASLREENIERANRIKQIVKYFNRPLIVTAELRKKTSEEGKSKKPTMHDLMESGKYGYNADVVWLIYPESESDYVTQSEPVIMLEFGKNKLSSFRESLRMTFVRAQSLIKPFSIGGQ